MSGLGPAFARLSISLHIDPPVVISAFLGRAICVSFAAYWLWSAANICGSEPAIIQLAVTPEKALLSGGDARIGILVTGETKDGWQLDLTRQAGFHLGDSRLAQIRSGGILEPRADGETTLLIEARGQSIQIPVKVERSSHRRPLHFEQDIVAVLSRFGCNTSGCHGKAEGQNGFKLSVFGFDPGADHRAITQEGRGRRVFPASPDRSLLLLKASGGSPHGGGVRIPLNHPEYVKLVNWITEGATLGPQEVTPVVRVELYPTQRRLRLGGQQQLRLIAQYADGQRTDVTHLARFQSNNEDLIAVDESGLTTAGQTPGVAAVMASFLGHVAVFEALIPRPESIPAYPKIPEFNFIDPLVNERLAQLQILPSELCTDEQYLRRVYLDLIGTLPTPDEVRNFLADMSRNRRAAIVETLFKRPEYADHWALYWADLLRVDRQALGHKAAYDYYRWIRETVATNKPVDKFAREIIEAEGPLSESPQGAFYATVPQPGQAASAVSQVFLGIRIDCAQCHHHPHDRWSQTDYFGMVAHFAQVQRKNSPWGAILSASGDPATKHPRTGERIFAHPLGAPAPTAEPLGDRRRALADWLASRDNPWFAKNIANRVWARLLGRGLVEPVDDVRSTNPPTNPALLDALGRRLADENFNMQALLRAIVASRAYQQSSHPNKTNAGDQQNYSRFLLKTMPAETLLDAICQATGVPEKLPGLPAGAHASQVWDSQAEHDFLRLFGRPTRQTVCECERVTEPSVAQVLHLLNSQRIQEKLDSETGTIARLTATHADDARLVEELYLSFLSRFPSEQERLVGVRHFRDRASDRRAAAEDFAWTLLNSLEFVFTH
jgi:hypothetical protein